MKIDFIHAFGEHTWCWIPTIQTWHNDFRSFDMGNHYAITIKWFNATAGLNINLKRKK